MNESNIKVNAVSQGWNAFMYACAFGNVDIVQMFLNKLYESIDMNVTDQVFGRTAFMWACSNGKTDVVRVLLQDCNKSIDLNATDNSGRTACMLADRYNRKDVVELLVNHATVEIKK